MKRMQIETDRLILRPWQPADLPVLATINQDAHVSEFFLAPLTPELTEQAVLRYQTAHDRDGYAFLAAEHKPTGELIGILGMQTMSLDVPGLSRPVVEIGWRIAYHHWGTGLATEGARAVIHYAFAVAHLPKVVAITSAINSRSRRVMEKLGMIHLANLDFDHPQAAPGHALQKHVVYELLSTQ
jgi:RimJ/RimL family protein N-acetyltransferase